MPDREHTDLRALNLMWELPMRAAVRWFTPIRTALHNFFYGLPPVFVAAAIPHRAAGLCLDCEVLFDTRDRQACPACAGDGWTLLARMQREAKRGRRLKTEVPTVLPLRRRA